MQQSDAFTQIAEEQPDSSTSENTSETSSIEGNLETGPELRKFVELLDYLARMTENEEVRNEDRYNAGFDPRRISAVDVDRVMSIISPAGVKFSDVNRNVQLGLLSAARIRKNLRAKRGVPFTTFAHLAYLRSKLFSWVDRSLVLEKRAAGQLIVGFDGYRLVFRTAEDGAVLVGCDYRVRVGH